MNSLADAAEEIKILDNIPVVVNLAELPGYWAELEASARVYGTDWLSSFWRFTVLRNLFPNRHQRLVKEWRRAHGRYCIEYLDALMIEGRIAFDERQAET